MPTDEVADRLLSEQQKTNELLEALLGNLSSASELVAKETHKREMQNRSTRRLLVICVSALVLLIFTVAAVGWGVNRQQRQSSQVSCASIVAAAVAGVDEAGAYYSVTLEERDRLNRRVALRVAETLPDCTGNGDYLPGLRLKPYETCIEVEADGAAPLREGQPGWNAALDGDDDGIACE